MNKVVLVTGGFDPLHSGHIEYFKAARELGDHLVVGLNSDEWLTRKKGRPFMSFKERAAIIKELECVDEVIGFNDSDNSACAAVMQILQTKSSRWKIVFANGGDRSSAKNTPEYATYGEHPDVEFCWGVGGKNKKNSSSWILDNWKTQKTERDWGYWRVLDDNVLKGYKVKELVINPKSSLSDQKHQYRSEHWYILSGELRMDTEYLNRKESVYLLKNKTYIVEKGVWHKAVNESDVPCHVLEVQYGEKCIEEDIERRDNE